MESLIQTLRSDKASFRAAAARAIGKMGPLATQAVPALVSALKDANRVVRTNCVLALGKIGPAAKDAVSPLVEMLIAERQRATNLRPSVLEIEESINAIWTLGQIGPSAELALPALVEARRSEVTAIRDAACKSLGLIRSCSAAAETALGSRYAAARALISTGASVYKALPVFVAAINSQGPELRANATQDLLAIVPLLLQDHEPAQAVSALLKLTRVNDRDVRHASIRALGELGPSAMRAVPRLITLTKRSDSECDLSVVVEAMAKIKCPVGDIVRAIIDLLEHQELSARGVVKLLTESGYDEQQIARSFINAMARREWHFPEMVPEFFRILGGIAAAAVPGLVRTLRGNCSSVNKLWGTVEALGRMGAVARDSVKVLIEGVREWNSVTSGLDDIHDRVWIRSRVAWALGEIGDVKALPALMKALKDHDQEDHDPDSVPDEANVRQAALEALGMFGAAAEPAVPLIVSILDDHDSPIRSDAISALGCIGPAASQALPALVEALRDSNSEVRACAAWALGNIAPFGKKYVPVLLESLQDPDCDCRVRAAVALAALGETGEEIVVVLNEAAKRVETPVRKGVLSALRTIAPLNKKAVLGLIGAMKSKDWRTRYHAIDAARAIGPAARRARRSIENALRDKSKRVRDVAAAALDALRSVNDGR